MSEDLYDLRRKMKEGDFMDCGKIQTRIALKEMQELQGMYDAELSRCSGLCPATIHRIKQYPDHDIKLSTLCLLADALDCTLDDLVEIQTE